MTNAFSGPSLVGLIPGMAGAVFVGMVYKSLAKTGYSLIFILLVREVADLALYQLVSFFADVRRNRAINYAATNLTINIATLACLYRFKIISTLGTAILVSLMAIELLCKFLDFSKYSSILPEV